MRILALIACAALTGAGHAAELTLEHHAPCNLWPSGQAVVLTATLNGFPGGATGTATADLVDYSGHAQQKTFPFVALADGHGSVPIDFGALEGGYYELRVTAIVAGDKPVSATSAACCLGVVAVINRSAERALAEGSRFGLKTFQLGAPGVWWNRKLVWNLSEAVDACAITGLQWTRHPLSQKASLEPGVISTLDLLTRHPLNAVLKVEGFPESCFDAKRYGSLDQWKKDKQDWARKTVPLKEPYQAWLREEIAQIPASQRVFEIGNEVWDKMSPEEFAELCRMSVEVIKAVRVDAIVGPNSAMGPLDWELKCIKAGGYEGITMLATHPYSFTPMPERRIRGWLRNYHDLIRTKLGHDLPLYVTEYGWSTAPKDAKYGRSEREQAQRTVRESLMLYAEDCRVIIPHWMGDREQDPKEREHWFGFLRLSMQPKPVFVAHAVSAQLIDRSRFLGDLPCGPGIGALLFERGGARTLALWTLDEAVGAGRPFRLAADAARVEVVGLMGERRTLTTNDGDLDLRLSGDVTYVVGVGAALSKRVIAPDFDLLDTVWNERPQRPLSALLAPVIDGDLAEWKDVSKTALPSPRAAAEVAIAYDDANLYLSGTVRDSNLLGGKEPGAGDALVFEVCPRPSRQPSIDGVGLLYNYTFTAWPAIDNLPPGLRIANAIWDAPLSPPADGSTGVRWAVVSDPAGWRVEIAVARNALPGFPARGSPTLSARFQLNNLEKNYGKIDHIGSGPEAPREWCLYEDQ